MKVASALQRLIINDIYICVLLLALDSGNKHSHIPGLSDRQKQLVDFQLQVKEGEISIGEAEHLLQDWLLRGRMRSDNSFKEKKVGPKSQ